MIHHKLCILGFVATLLVSGAKARLPTEGIVGGDIADDNQFPYQVSLQYYGSSFCGGGIIGDRFILTAAHCVVERDGRFRNRRISVVAGTSDLSMTSRAVKVEVAKIYVPTGYQPQHGSDINDIAVLRLKEPLGLRQHRNLKALQLPRNARRTYAGETVKISGFGWDWVEVLPGNEEYGGNSDTKLRFAEADVLSNAQCQQDYDDNLISDTQICARTKQRFISRTSGVCSGDSGGPLVHGGNTIVGVVSTSPVGCTERVSAAVYTRVSSYLGFIVNAVKDRQTSYVRTLELIPTSRPSPNGGYTTRQPYASDRPYYVSTNRPFYINGRPTLVDWNSYYNSFYNPYFIRS